jgi:putative acetyltransferase
MTNTSLVLTPVQLAHADRFHACLDAVAREQQFLAQSAAPPLERVREFVAGSVRDDAVQFMLLDTSGAANPQQAPVVGWCDIFAHWADGLKHVGTLGMGLLPAYRGRGLGRQLMAACLVKAAAKGITRVELSVRVDNHAAIALYERMGFAPEARKHRGMRMGGQYHDTLAMSLLLDEPAEDAELPEAQAARRCVLCGAENHCALADGRGNPCWCTTARLPATLLARVPEGERGAGCATRCICPRCAALALMPAELAPPA